MDKQKKAIALIDRALAKLELAQERLIRISAVANIVGTADAETKRSLQEDRLRALDDVNEALATLYDVEAEFSMEAIAS